MLTKRNILTNKRTSINEYIIFSKGSLLHTLNDFQQIISDYFQKLKNVGIDASTNQLYHINNFILNDYVHYKNNPFFKLKKQQDEFIKVSYSNFNMDINMTTMDYLKLLIGMMKLYNNSFSINYENTCPGYVYVKDQNLDKINNERDLYAITPGNILNNRILEQELVYCKYYKIISDKGTFFEPVFIGSCSYNNPYQTLFIYNVCSNVNYFNRQSYLPKSYSTKKTHVYFNEMLHLFLEYTKKNTCYLFVESRNPSFAKAFSLYYKCGFKPLFANEGQDPMISSGLNLLEIAYNCLSSPNIDGCRKNTFPLLLMGYLKHKNISNHFLLNYNCNLFCGKNTSIVPRDNSKLSLFYDYTLATSYRYSCIFDRYFEINKKICEDIIDTLTEYFEMNSGLNKTITDNGINYWNILNGYITGAENNQFPSQVNKMIIDNKKLYRYIACLNSNYLNLDNNMYNKKKINIKIKEDINGKRKINIAIEQGFFKNNSNIPNYDIDVDPKKPYDVVIDDYKLEELEKHVNVISSNGLLFFCIGSIYESDKDNTQNLSHVVSVIFNNNSKEFYFYDSQLIQENVDEGYRYTIKFLVYLLKEILVKKLNNVDIKNYKVLDISRYKNDVNPSNSIYAKIQQPYSDDNSLTLCTMLSHIPYIFCRIESIKKSTDMFKNAQFIVWLLTFYSIKLKQQEKTLNVIQEIKSNISIIFPYIYCKVYNFIEKINVYKINNMMNLRYEDKYIQDKLLNYTKTLESNISELEKIISNIIYSKFELNI